MLARAVGGVVARAAAAGGAPEASPAATVAAASRQCLRGPAGAHIRTMATTPDWVRRGTGTGTVEKAEMIEFMKRCFLKVGTPEDHAVTMAQVLTEADHRGHYSHGLNRLEMYINDIQTKSCDAVLKPNVLNETPATAWVDGQNGLGPVVGTFCMDLAIAKAKEAGIGFVCAKGSNHYGIAGWYSIMAVKEKLLGMSMTNTSPFMTPTRAKESALGTNPLTLAAPAEGDDFFCLDMATTAVAVGKIEVKKRNADPIPSGWALDAEGRPTTDAESAMAGGRLLPLGGEEQHSGYKGYGLGLMVEVLCGILGDSLYGPNIRRWGDTDKAANLGQCFMAINPAVFAPNFETRMSDIMSSLRGMEPLDCRKPVLVAGDPERQHMQMVDKNNGIPYSSAIIDATFALAKKLDVQPPCVK